MDRSGEFKTEDEWWGEFLRQWIKADTSSITNCILKCFSELFRNVSCAYDDVKGAKVAAMKSFVFDNSLKSFSSTVLTNLLKFTLYVVFHAC